MNRVLAATIAAGMAAGSVATAAQRPAVAPQQRPLTVEDADKGMPHDWRYVAAGGEGSAMFGIFADRLSVRRNAAGHRLMEVMLVYFRPLPSGLSHLAGATEIDCQRSRQRLLTTVRYDTVWTPLATAGVRPWVETEPDTTIAQEQRVACDGFQKGDLAFVDPVRDGRSYMLEQERREKAGLNPRFTR